GLQTDAGACRVTLAPHVPADWTWFTIDHVRAGSASLRIAYRKTIGDISLTITRSGSGNCSLEFSPAVSPRAQIMGVEMNGRRMPFQIKKSDVDQHIAVQFPISAGENTLHIRLRNDFGLSLSPTLPSLGSTSQGFRVLSESWTPSRDTLTLDLAGASGKQYELGMWNPSQVASVEGAELSRSNAENARINITIPKSESDPYPREKIIIHFTSKTQ
ncbi:MAG: hypothetical protein WBQ68_16695, partial [Terriglobales bacterium]